MKKILIANRGEIAVRIIRTCQEMGISTVAVHSSADKDSLHAKLADESICIGPGPSLNSYLSIPNLMSAAELCGVDALHPGYGFLAESPELADICSRYRIKFIGPTAEQIRLLGDKIQARKIARESGVPLLPGSHGVIRSGEEALRLASDIGYPILIKAAAGGGGRGMKIVYSAKELLQQFDLACKEAIACFGKGDCFMEKFLESPRHIEVQILADEHGQVEILGERDCSLQRRLQKIVEEAPCAFLSEQERKQVVNYARQLVEFAGYQSLGTVEFLYEKGNFYFMEMNTRVQVEHPVTEMVFALDLIKEQIQVAQGKKLSGKKNFYQTRGHALECRINAEDPETFVPWPGKITAYHEPGGHGVRVDSMVYTGYVVPSLYDSLLAKIIVHGTDRDHAIKKMQRALKEMKIEGIRTNKSLHEKILQHKSFIKGELSTNALQKWFF